MAKLSRDSVLQDAFEAAGGQSALADKLGLSQSGVCQWKRVPVSRVLAVEQATGIPKEKLRPDIYGQSDAEAA